MKETKTNGTQKKKQLFSCIRHEMKIEIYWDLGKGSDCFYSSNQISGIYKKNEPKAAEKILKDEENFVKVLILCA